MSRTVGGRRRPFGRSHEQGASGSHQWVSSKKSVYLYSWLPVATSDVVPQKGACSKRFGNSHFDLGVLMQRIAIAIALSICAAGCGEGTAGPKGAALTSDPIDA